MARAATSRSRNLRGFGWLTKKKATYRRDVRGERAELIREAKAERARKVRDEREEKAAARGKAQQLLEELKDDAYAAGQSDKQSGRKPFPYRITLLVSPRWEEAFGKQRARQLVQGSYARGYKHNPQCARTVKSKVTDRAKRYRANQPGCRPSGLKKCKLCGSRSDVMVDHVDGNESNGRKSNLRWLCRSCNNTLGAEMAKGGIGRRTVQYNPAHKGAQTLGEYMQAVLQHTRRAHDAGGKIIHDTPKSKRRDFAAQIWAARGSHGTMRPGSGRTGQDEPDWVSNPANSTAFGDRTPLKDGIKTGRVIGERDKREGRDSLAGERDRLVAILKDYWNASPRQLADYSRGLYEGYRDGYAKAKRSNPESAQSSTEYRLGYNLGQMDRQTAQLPKTWAELEAMFNANFPAGTRTSALPFFQAYQDGYGVGAAARQKGLRNGNPATDSDEYEQAKRIAELFHGRPVKEELTVTEQIREHDWLWRIGPLVSLKIRTVTKRNATLPFHQSEEGMVHLFCSPDGRQFYLRGGDQELNLEALGMGPGTEWYRDHMLIGEAKEITYRDKKKFHRFKIVDYFHKLGEVTKKKPMLAYDAFAHKMAIVGGQYKVETEDLVDDMSPGIVN